MIVRSLVSVSGPKLLCPAVVMKYLTPLLPALRKARRTGRCHSRMRDWVHASSNRKKEVQRWLADPNQPRALPLISLALRPVQADIGAACVAGFGSGKPAMNAFYEHHRDSVRFG
jgi:hypothetical protein